MQLLREWEEHNSLPGTRYDDCLMLDAGFDIVLNEMDLHETTTSGGVRYTRFRGKVQEADTINKNKRKYTRDILEQNVTRLNEVIARNGLIGECDHPADSIVHFEKASHKITKLWWEGNVVMCEGVLLHTLFGEQLAKLINFDNVRIGMSSRGVGSGKVDNDGVLVIGESYKLITFDAVADPSTHQAFQDVVGGKKREAHAPRPEILVPKRTKNEERRIDTASNSGLWLACLDGIFRHQTEKAKERIHS